MHCIIFHLIAHPLLASLEACAPFQTSAGRKTKTSSDASREAPERARKDTPKEVKLHKGSYPSVRLSGEVSQAFT